MQRSSVEKGRLGEEEAWQYLLQNGYSLVARNFRCSSGEVDIVVYKDGILSFVEVKSWNKVTALDLEVSLSTRKRSRLIECARCFLAQNTHWRVLPVRFDVFFLTKNEKQYYIDAFTENGFK